MKKLILNFLLIGIVILGVTGCGSKTETEQNNNQNVVQENLEDTNLKQFIRTYNVLNVAKSDDENYVYLTIRQYQKDEVQTIKVKKELCPDVKKNKNYEFTIKPNKSFEDNIVSIFSNSEIISIKITDKVGLDQIQE